MAYINPDPPPGFTPTTLALKQALRAPGAPIWTQSAGGKTFDLHHLAGGLWLIVRRPGKGGLALRCAPDTLITECTVANAAEGVQVRAVTASGAFDIAITASGDLFRVTTDLTPADDLLVPYWSRDLYPLDASDDPTGARGWVEAGQRGFNAPVCFLSFSAPAFGAALYMQNLTALNPFFAATKTKPDGSVGGVWPELGYEPPTREGSAPPDEPLKRGERVTISDAIVALSDEVLNDEAHAAGLFIDMLARIYPLIGKPEPQQRDWPRRAEKTFIDLQTATGATVREYGHIFIRPYLGAEYPDCMVQLAVLTPLTRWERKMKRPSPFSAALRDGLEKFHDRDLHTLRRYLPSVGKDKNADAVDSWYLYHPLINLARLAAEGDDSARTLLLDCLPYAIKAARHFEYKWPIMFDVTNFAVIEASRNAQGLGQTDVGGVYAYLMIQAHELTGDDQYIDEAVAAVRALKGLRFELAYQTNLTAWGAVACAKLARLTGDQDFMRKSLIHLAGFMHNCEIWNSEIGHARNYTNFLGVTCLHDAPYMAAFECFDSTAAMTEYLQVAADRAPNSVALLLKDYCRYALDRAWFFYPDALPEDAVTKKDIRNGRIDRARSFPLEDLYGDGQEAGKVGQEVYGAGGAFTFALMIASISPVEDASAAPARATAR